MISCIGPLGSMKEVEDGCKMGYTEVNKRDTPSVKPQRGPKSTSACEGFFFFFELGKTVEVHILGHSKGKAVMTTEKVILK